MLKLKGKSCLSGMTLTCYVNSHCLFLQSSLLICKKVNIINKGMVCLVDCIFWIFGFKTEMQAEKVIFLTHPTDDIIRLFEGAARRFFNYPGQGMGIWAESF
jgi:hypothetical protein